MKANLGINAALSQVTGTGNSSSEIDQQGISDGVDVLTQRPS